MNPIKKIWRPFLRFFQAEANSGIYLLASVILALIFANLWPDSYNSLLNREISLGYGAISLDKPLILWINKGLMTIFFLVVGLEIKRELLVGELATRKNAMLPAMAAIGGMVVPACIYLVINASGDGIHGWGIPMATDIAFAVGVLALLKKRIPFALKVFLTALAIIDDIGAVIIIAFFYTGSISWTALAAGLGLFILLLVMNQLGVMRSSVYLLLGFGLWLALLESGVHATIAGVLLALTIPSKSSGARPSEAPLLRLERYLGPWIAYLIVPVFALANSGISFEESPLGLLGEPIGLGVILGLVVGKPAGVVLFSWIAIRLGIGSMPRSVTWRHLLGAACLAGIGFTMSLFITLLAFEDATQLAVAKTGILVASLIAGLLGWALLFTAKRA
ncbi:MAG: Na+/H+ antiporter NhaA [Thermoleophilia bacterium]